MFVCQTIVQLHVDGNQAQYSPHVQNVYSTGI